MALLEREAAIAAAATAAALSPEVRSAVRKGAVYGLAGILKAGDVVMSAARGAVQGAQAAAGDETVAASAPAAPARRAAGSKSSAARKRPAQRPGPAS